jgi:hypothetical protein
MVYLSSNGLGARSEADALSGDVAVMTGEEGRRRSGVVSLLALQPSTPPGVTTRWMPLPSLQLVGHVSPPSASTSGVRRADQFA